MGVCFRAPFGAGLWQLPPRPAFALKGFGAAWRGWSAERRIHLASRLPAGRALRFKGASPSGAPPCGFLVPGAVLPGADPGAALRPPRPEGFRPPSFRTIVQPLRAGPRSGAGRLAGASREWGYKPRPRAPPPPHVKQCPAERPSRGVVGIVYRNIVLSRNISQVTRKKFIVRQNAALTRIGIWPFDNSSCGLWNAALCERGGIFVKTDGASASRRFLGAALCGVGKPLA